MDEITRLSRADAFIIANKGTMYKRDCGYVHITGMVKEKG